MTSRIGELDSQSLLKLMRAVDKVDTALYELDMVCNMLGVDFDRPCDFECEIGKLKMDITRRKYDTRTDTE